MNICVLTSVPGNYLGVSEMLTTMASNLPGDWKENMDGHSSAEGQNTLPGCQGTLRGQSDLQASLSGSWP